MSWKKRAAAAGVVVVAGFVAVALFASSATVCSDVDQLIAQSATRFESIQGDLVDPAAGEWSTTVTVGDASACSVIVDVERASHQCSWDHDDQTSADEAYRSLVSEVRSCFDPPAQDRTDASVNHPDFWASTYFELPAGDVSVSLKNKTALSTTFVTLQVDSR